MNTMGERLVKARKDAGFRSARSAAVKIGIPVSTFNSHERAESPGGRTFDFDQAKLYGQRFGVSPTWLLTGEGEPARARKPVATESAGFDADAVRQILEIVCSALVKEYAERKPQVDVKTEGASLARLLLEILREPEESLPGVDRREAMRYQAARSIRQFAAGL